MRCKDAAQPAIEPGIEAFLCERHCAEWRASGLTARPTAPAEAPAPKAPKALPVPEAARAEIEPTRVNLEQALQVVSSIALDSQGALDWLGEARTCARRALEWLEERRTSITKPMLEAKRAVDAVFEPSKQQAQAVIKCCDTRLAEFEAGRRKAQDAALAAVGQGAADEHTLVAAHGGELELPSQVTKRRVLCVKITDANAVPRPFLQLDESLALAYARERGQDSCKVPGLEFYYEEHIITARGAT